MKRNIVHFGFVLFCMFVLSGCVNSITYDNESYPSTGTIEMILENQGQKIDFSKANEESVFRIKEGSYILLESSKGGSVKITDLYISDIDKVSETAILSFDYNNLSADTYTINDSFVVFEYLQTPDSLPQEKKLDIRCSPVFEVKGDVRFDAFGYNGEYDGKEHGITVTVSRPENAVVKYGESEDSVILDSSPTYSKPGKYAVYYSITSDNYNTVNGSAYVIIDNLPIQYEARGVNVVYDGKEHSPYIEVKEPEEFYIRYGLYEDDYSYESMPVFTDAGVYKVYYLIAAQGYQMVYDSVDVVIEEKEIEYEAKNTNVIYDGKEYGIHIDVKNVENAVIKYGTNVENIILDESPKYKELGIYPVYYLIKADNHSTVVGNVKIAITKEGISDDFLNGDVPTINPDDLKEQPSLNGLLLVLTLTGIIVYALYKRNKQ